MSKSKKVSAMYRTMTDAINDLIEIAEDAGDELCSVSADALRANQEFVKILVKLGAECARMTDMMQLIDTYKERA